MLSIVKIQSSNTQRGYYLNEQGSYYLEEAKEKGFRQWMGKGAAEQGLSGSIDEKIFKKVFNGELPSGDVVGIKNPENGKERRTGYDFTFSMNKDISLIICCTKNKELKDYFLNAHLKAVETVMNEVEKTVSARKTVKGKVSYEKTGNMITALCTHFISREGDPQVHTHALVANATKRPDGMWRALSTDMTRENGFFEQSRDKATFLGHIYQYEMAHAAVKRGFDVIPVKKHGMFALKGFSTDIRDDFSKRRKQILEAVELLDHADKKDKIVLGKVAKVTAAPKENKENATIMSMSKEYMRDALNKIGYKKTFDDYIEEKLHKKEQSIELPKQHTQEAVEDAVKALSVFHVKMDHDTIVKKAMILNRGCSSYSDLKKAVDQYLDQGGLLLSSSGHYTSKDLLNKEKYFVSMAAQSVSNDISLDAKEVKTAVDYLKESRLCLVKEPSSLKGKREAISKLIDSFEKDGQKVSILTQTKTLADEYNGFNKGSGESFWQRLVSINKEDKAESLHGFIQRGGEPLKRRALMSLSKKEQEVLIVEDTNSLGFDAASKLMSISEIKNKKIVFLSYDEGRKTPLAGNVVALLNKAGVPVSMEFINKEEKKNTMGCRVQEVRSDLNAGPKEKRFSRQQQLASDLVQTYGNDLDGVQVLSSTALGVKTQSTFIRMALKDEGLIGDKDYPILVERPVYLTLEERKHAKYFKSGWVAKTYAGNGQFEEKTISGRNVKTNKVLVNGVFGRKKYLSPGQILKDSGTRLFEQDELLLADQDKVKLSGDNKQAKLIGISINTSYRVSIDKNSATLTPDNSTLKTIKTRLSKLNGLNLSHDYAKTISQDRGTSYHKKSAMLDACSYSLDKKTLNDLSRRYDSVDIYTDNKKKAENNLLIAKPHLLATEMTFVEKNKEEIPVQKSVSFGLSVVGAREAAFTLDSAIKESFSFVSSEYKFKDVVDELRDRVKSGELKARKSPSGEVLLATQATIDLETSVIDQIKQGKSSVVPFMSKDLIGEKLHATELKAGQKEACSLLASTSDRFVMIQGYAGTGKSTMLESLKKALEETGSIKEGSIIALAPTHKAVQELKNKGMESQTLKSFLVDEGSRPKDMSQHLEGKLILLDESSMVSNRDFKSLQDIVEKAKSCHCGYIGDDAQLQSVESGAPSKLVYIAKKSDIATATMDDVLRQKDPDLRAIASNMTKGSRASFAESFALLEEKGWVRQSKDSEELISDIAKGYVSLSADNRKNTLVAIATNLNRGLVNNAIRERLSKQGEITGDTLKMTHLIDSGLTDAELRQAMFYSPGNVVKVNNSYFDVLRSNKDSNSLELKGEDKQPSYLNLNEMTDNKQVELFSKTSLEVQKGDSLKWTKTDSHRGVLAHNRLEIESVDSNKNTLIAKTESGKQVLIDMTQRQNQHVDYSYASTVHGLQGATSKSVMFMLDSRNKRSNSMRLMYVAMTRSEESAFLYTDNLNKVRDQILAGKGDKRIALEAMNMLEQREQSNDMMGKPKTSTRKSAPIKSDQKSYSIDVKEVEEGLKDQVKIICNNLLGDPNQSLSNAKSWRYGKKGSLSISVEGENKGLFCNFETDEKGGMIKLLMSELGLDFKSALNQGHRMLGGDAFIAPSRDKREPIKHPNMIVDALTSKDQEALDRKKAYIGSLIDRSTPIYGSVAEKYLKGRSIYHCRDADIRSLHQVNTGGGNNQIRSFSSALMSIAKNKEGDVTAIQLTYLDPMTGEKLTELPIPKRTIGSLQNSFVTISPAEGSTKTTFVAEGIETALTISDSLKSMGSSGEQVLASLGKSNLKNLSHIDTADNVVLVLDNDNKNWRLDKTIISAVEELEKSGKVVICIQPESITGEKIDYNDLAQSGKSQEIKTQLSDALSGKGETIKAQEETKEVNRASRDDREMFG